MKLEHGPGVVALILAAAFYSPAAYPVKDVGGVAPAAPVARSEAGVDAEEPPAGLTRDDWSQIRTAVQASEYHASPVAKPGEGPTLQAPNRQQAYRTTFRRDGIEIVPQASAGASWRLGLSVTGYGYEGDVRSLEPAEPQELKDRVEYRRGPVTEWYVNRPGGLEQGFELEEPKPRRAGPLVIAMTVTGDLEVSVSESGASFAGRSGTTQVRYAGLKAWDAEGHPLEARVEAADREVRLIVEAQTARYPVTIDPTFVHEAQFFGRADPIGTARDEFGFSVSVSGDTVVVGARGENANTGAAHVFVRSGAAWTEQQRLVPSAGGEFGSAVSLSGDTVVVGAPRENTPGLDAGSAYVFVRSGTTWTEQQKLLALDAAQLDNFGSSVSLFGDTAVIGAPRDDTPGGANAGSAYVFIRSGTTWTQQQKLLASDGVAEDAFGYAVSVSGNTVAVGAITDDTPAGAEAGSAYVFVRSGTTWTQQQKLIAPDGAAIDLFGNAVEVSGDTVVVGAYADGVPGGYAEGSAYVFVRSGATWTLQQKLLASDAAVFAGFGVSVAISGDTIVVGARKDDAAGSTRVSAAYVFVRSGAIWTQQQKLLASDGVPGEQFGRSVSVSGETVVVGAPATNNPRAGAAYAFVRSGAVWTQQQKLFNPETVAGDYFGYSVSVSGNAAVIGAYGDDTSAGVDAGSVYVFVRAGTTWTEEKKLFAPDGETYDLFGWSVSISGNTIVVGAPSDSDAFGNGGAAYVFVRSGASWSLQQKLQASDAAPNDFFGHSVSISGDTLVCGASSDDTPGGVNAGSAYVFVRSGTTWTQQQKLLAPDGALNDAFGNSVSISGDTVVVGASFDDTPGGETGSAYVFVRSGTTWTQQQKLLPADAANFDRFGVSVSVFGDSAVIGAYLDDTPAGMNAGSAYVFARSGTTWTQQQKLVASDGAGIDLFGTSVALFGDTVDSDDNAGGVNAGAAYVFARSGTTWTQQAKFLAPDGASDNAFGCAVSVSDDTTVIGARLDTAPGGYEGGSVHVFRDITPRSDLGVTKTDGQPTAVPGQSLTYTITVTNAGPSAVAGASFTDLLPATLSGATWTCVASPGSSCTTSGSGDINDVINLLAGGTATYSVTGTVDPAASGMLVNTATVAAPVGVTDPISANNAATDADTLTPQADLAITKTDDQPAAIPGQPVTYTIVAANSGPSNASSATVKDTFPETLTGVVWTCIAVGGASCTGAGSGNINDTVNLPVGGTATYTATGTVDAGARGTLQNTATVTAPVGVADPNPANNNATDTDALPGVDYYTLAPCRVVDTRGGAPIGGPVLQGQQTRAFAVAGTCGIPSTAKAVSLNLAVTQPSVTGNVRLFPAGQAAPTVSSINYAAGQTRGNNAIVQLDFNGAMAAFVGQPAGTTVHLILDVNGYFE